MDRRERICTTRNRNNDDNYSSSNNTYSNNNNNNNGFAMQWTNEMHSNFMRLMEASFVRNMIGRRSSSNNNNANSTSITTSAHPVVCSRLDRYVPDISESTLDLHRSAHLTDRVTRTCNRQKERAIIRPYRLSHDQVVPQQEDRAGDKAV